MVTARSRWRTDWVSSAKPSLIQPRSTRRPAASTVRCGRSSRHQPARALWMLAPRLLCAHGGPVGGARRGPEGTPERNVAAREAAAVGHVNVGYVLRVGLPPRHPVPRVQGHGGLVPFGYLDRGRDVLGVAVGADDREDLTVAHRVEHPGRVGAGI